MTAITELQCRTWWVLLPLLSWGCAGGYSGDPKWVANDDSGTAIASSDGIVGIVVGESDSLVGESGAPACQPNCVGKTCGDSDGCGGTCQAGCGGCTPACAGKLCGDSDGCGGTCASGSGCCTPACAGKLCGAADGCGGTCKSGGGCCTPSCSGKSCGAGDGCGGTCKIGSGCSTSCGAWQAVNPNDPWDDPDPNYDGERGCGGSLVKDFGTVGLEATCRAKCEKVGAACCQRDHRAGQKSCRAYDGNVIVKGGCTGCTAASCK